MTGDEKAIQTQKAADAINAALANFSSGAAFFGMALYLAQYLYHHVKEDDQEEQLKSFTHIVLAFSKHAHTGGQNIN